MTSSGTSMLYNFISSLIIYGTLQKNEGEIEDGQDGFYPEGLKELNGGNESRILWALKYVDIDIDYARWLYWLFSPIALSFVLPIAILFFLYSNSTFLYIYKLHRHRLINAYQRRDFFDGARKTLAALWDAQGWFYFGYEVQGLENIPEQGGALLVYYHGAIPIDFYYLLAKCILFKGRLIRTVGDRFLFKIPGFGSMLEAFKVIPGTVQTCSTILKEGHVLAISPGGVYEAQFGDEYYQLLWKSRIGFAKAALEAQVPILPMFTKNIRESFRCVNIGSRFWHWLYLKTRLPCKPIYGFFPVKLVTYIGKPIPCKPDHTPETLAQEVSKAIEELIKKHQRLPGSIIQALLDRVFISRSLNKDA